MKPKNTRYECCHLGLVMSFQASVKSHQVGYLIFYLIISDFVVSCFILMIVSVLSRLIPHVLSSDCFPHPNLLSNCLPLPCVFQPHSLACLPRPLVWEFQQFFLVSVPESSVGYLTSCYRRTTCVPIQVYFEMTLNFSLVLGSALWSTCRSAW